MEIKISEDKKKVYMDGLTIDLATNSQDFPQLPEGMHGTLIVLGPKLFGQLIAEDANYAFENLEEIAEAMDRVRVEFGIIEKKHYIEMLCD